jgi:hypothetical protein
LGEHATGEFAVKRFHFKILFPTPNHVGTRKLNLEEISPIFPKYFSLSDLQEVIDVSSGGIFVA